MRVIGGEFRSRRIRSVPGLDVRPTPDRLREALFNVLAPRIAGVTFEVACDVDNPLLGDRGAAAVYGPQKGATPALVTLLDSRNADWADALEGRTGRLVRDTPGAGAAPYCDGLKPGALGTSGESTRPP